MSIAASIFGPEYIEAVSVDFGVLDLQGNPTSIVRSTDVRSRTSPDLESLLLPPGGYIVKYISGAFLLLNGDPAVFVVGGKRGMRIEWKSSVGRDWTSVGYPIELEAPSVEAFRSVDTASLNNCFYMEFTVPHRLKLTPPCNSVGNVRVRIWRHIPPVLIGQREQ
jgi:hypothetical protein